MTSDNLNSSGAALIDQLITFPFSSSRLLEPQFSAVGIGSYCATGFCETVIVPRLGLDKDVFLSLYDGDNNDRMWRAALGPMPREQQVLKHPIEFPPDGSTVAIDRFAGGDYVPIEKSCPGYAAPTGPAIVFELGKGDSESGAIAATNQNVSRDGQQMESCLLTAQKFCDLKAEFAQQMCAALTFRGAVVIMPRNPLAPGHYTVSLEADSRPHRWSFTVAPPAASAK
jgi:hypothetical protein